MQPTSIRKKIEQVLSPFAGKNERIYAAPAKTEKKEEYAYAIFFNSGAFFTYFDDWDIDLQCEDIIIWQEESKGEAQGRWGFSYKVHDPGVRYHKDGSGTPPSDEMVDHPQLFSTLENCVSSGIAKYLMDLRIAELKEEQLNCHLTFEE